MRRGHLDQQSISGAQRSTINAIVLASWARLGRCAGRWNVGLILAWAFVASLLLSTGCAPSEKRLVIIYTSQDQEYAEPILRDFTRETGIEVRAVYDSEAVKTVGLANRLLAEQSHPQCDVFWNNEEMRTRLLAAKNVFAESDPWRNVGYRSRRIVINTNLVSMESAPKSVSELTNRQWQGKVALAYPMFGTTSTHILALREHWGTDRWRAWCGALVASRAFLVDGNSVVVKLVGKGEALVGLTDSDDISAGQREGLPVAALPLNDELLLIPNTVALIRGAPHLPEAHQLLEYLQRREVVQRLVTLKALEGTTPGDVATPTLNAKWSDLLAHVDQSTLELKGLFLR